MAGRIDDDVDGVVDSGCNATDPVDKGSLCRLRNADPGRIRVTGKSHVADVDIAITSRNAGTCANTNRDVATAGDVVVEGEITDGCIACARVIVLQCTHSTGCVKEAGGVGKKGKRSVSGVRRARTVAQKRPRPSGRILVCGVDQERSSADARVEVTVSDA